MDLAKQSFYVGFVLVLLLRWERSTFGFVAYRGSFAEGLYSITSVEGLFVFNISEEQLTRWSRLIGSVNRLSGLSGLDHWTVFVAILNVMIIDHYYVYYLCFCSISSS